MTKASSSPDIVVRLRRAMESTTDEVVRNDLREIVRDMEADRCSAGNARLTELAQALVAIQEDMPSEDVRNCLGEAAHYLEKFAALGDAQPSPDSVLMPREPTPTMVSAGMEMIPEDGSEYEHVEAAYRAMVAVVHSSTNREAGK